MALTESTMLELGAEAPDFSLPDVVTGESVQRSAVAREKGLLAMFICNHCPFVKHVEAELARIGQDYRDHPIGIVAISSNDAATHPEDAPEKLRQQAQRLHLPFRYLHDETQETAQAYKAACTPDFFLFDSNLKLAYRGQLDDSRPGNDKPVTGADLRAAIDLVLAGKAVPAEQKPSSGCNIKWRAGNAPAY